MTTAELQRLIHQGLREYYAKQDIDLTEELDFALRDQAEFLARMLHTV